MSFTETVFARRSIRKFTDESISEETVRLLLSAGMSAPTACNTQPWHFMIIEKRETLEKITEICPNGAMLKGAPMAIFVLGDLNKCGDYCPVDCSAAVENILLTAQAEGLGACWIGVYPRPERIKGLNELFDLPENIMPQSLIALGHPAETKEPNNRYLEDRVHRERW